MKKSWVKFKYFGYDKVTVENCLSTMCEDNLRTIERVSLLLLMLVFIITSFYLIFDNNPVRNVICITGGLCALYTFCASRKMLDKEHEFTVAQANRLTNLFTFVCFLVGIYLSTFAADGDMAVATIWMFFFAILIFNRLPVQNLVTLLTACILFIICSFMTKSPNVFRYDVLHAFTSISASIVVSWEKSKMKVENVIALEKLHSVNMRIMETVEEQEREAALLWHRANRDELTGLYKKKTFEDKVKELLLVSNKNSLHAMVCVDIDNFKCINDTFGHLFGDKVLKEISSILLEKTTHENIIGRFGGDEFCIFLPNIEDKKTAELIIKSILECGRIEYECNGKKQSVSLSIGIAYYPVSGTTYHNLFGKADEALYYSKNNGKNRYNIR